MRILVDMAPPKTPLKALLILSLAVLLMHLALLQSLPLSVHNTAPDAPISGFATRTLAPEPTTNTAPARSLATKPTPRPTAAAKATKKPVPTAPVDVATTSSTQGSTAVAQQDSDTGSGAPTPELPTADRPELAPEPTVVPEPVAAPPPPREKAPSFRMEGLPGSVKLVYKVEANKFPYSLNGELLWTQKDGVYLATLSFGAFGQTRTQTSRGQIGAQGLAPARFSDKFRSEVAAHFNQDQAKVTFSANTPDAPLLSGAQDRLSVLIQLAALVASAPERFEAGTTLTIQTIGPRDADLWLFTVGELESMALPGGTVQGLKLTRNPRQPYDQQVVIWLAPQLGYLPARIRITEANGDYIDQKWAASEAAAMP